MSAHEVVMPSYGMAMTEGVVVAWLKQPGDPVEAGESIAEIETDKATSELESPASGRLGPLLVEAGEAVPVGAPLTTIVDGATAVAAAGNGNGGPPAAASSPAATPGPAAAPAPADPAPVATRSATAAADAAQPVTHPAGRVEPPQAPPLAPRPEGTPAATPRRRRRGPPRYERVGVDAAGHVSGEQLVAIELDGLAPEQVLRWLETMVLIREFEVAGEEISGRGRIPGGIHSSAGQEAVAVGTASALLDSDVVAGSHRSHHHCLAKGMDPQGVMAELYGKATGPLGGRGGHMHLADFRIGVFGSNGIVGAGVGIALGAAYAAKARQLDQIAVGFCGDGAANIGRLWEFVNLAAVWSLPLVVVCENNLYAVETDSRELTGGGDVADRAAGFGLPVVQVDGQDVAAVHRVMKEARERAVAGGGPTFVEAFTYRYSGHSAGEAELYRTPEEVERWRATRDPLLRAGRALVAAGALAEDGLERLHDQARERVRAAIAFAEESPWPDPATATLAVMSIDRWTEEVSR